MINIRKLVESKLFLPARKKLSESEREVLHWDTEEAWQHGFDIPAGGSYIEFELNPYISIGVLAANPDPEDDKDNGQTDAYLWVGDEEYIYMIPNKRLSDEELLKLYDDIANSSDSYDIKDYLGVWGFKSL